MAENGKPHGGNGVDPEGGATQPPSTSNNQGGAERRQHLRHSLSPQGRLQAAIRVDTRKEDTFLFAYVANISSLGIFVQTNEPEPPGTVLELVFPEEGGKGAGLTMRGEVIWVNAERPGVPNNNPGMGVRFLDVDREQRECLMRLVRRIAYLNESNPAMGSS